MGPQSYLAEHLQHGLPHLQLAALPRPMDMHRRPRWRRRLRRGPILRREHRRAKGVVGVAGGAEGGGGLAEGEKRRPKLTDLPQKDHQ